MSNQTNLHKIISTNKATISKLKTISSKLKEHKKNTEIAKLSGAVTSTVGGLISIAGLLAAPFTFGSTLPLIGAGAAIAGGGGAVTIGTIIAELIIVKTLCEDANKLLEANKILTRELENNLTIQLLKGATNLNVFAEKAVIILRAGGFKIADISFKTGLPAATVSKVLLNAALRNSMTILFTGLNIIDMITLSININKGSVSVEAEKLDELIEELERNTKNLETIYQNL